MTNVERKGWRDQWERIARFLTRFEEINVGRPHRRPTEFYTDIVYAAFQNLWHLKDWLKNDPAAGAGDVESFWQAEPALILGADLANGSKHLLLSDPKGDPKSNVAARHIRWKVDEGSIAIRYDVDASGTTFDAFSVACDAKAAWEKYLKRKGLL